MFCLARIFIVYILCTTSLYAEENQQLIEPSIDKLIEWIPEQIPRTVSFYFDTDGDGQPDIIIAYFLIEAYACKEKCSIEFSEYHDHWILVSAIGSNPYSYYIIKKWSMWRETDKDDWKSIKKSSDSVYKYKDNDEWFNDRFLKLWPDMAP